MDPSIFKIFQHILAKGKNPNFLQRENACIYACIPMTINNIVDELIRQYYIIINVYECYLVMIVDILLLYTIQTRYFLF